MASIEDDAESISRLAQAVWLIGQLLIESEQGLKLDRPSSLWKKSSITRSLSKADSK
jgi:hypothetical protein